MGKEYSYQIAVTCDDGCRFEKTDKGKVWNTRDAIGELTKQLKKIQAMKTSRGSGSFRSFSASSDKRSAR